MTILPGDDVTVLGGHDGTECDFAGAGFGKPIGDTALPLSMPFGSVERRGGGGKVEAARLCFACAS